MLSLLFWYGGLVGMTAAMALVLWALVQHVVERPSWRFAGLLLMAGLALAAVSSWAVIRSAALAHEEQLHRVREPLNALMASTVYVRGTLADVQAAAEPSTPLTDLLSRYDRHEASIGSLFDAEWRYQRAGAWDERALLYKATWDVTDILVHHARWEKRDSALQCPAVPDVLALADLMPRLQDRLQTHRVNAAAIGEQFEGFGFPDAERDRVSDATVVRGIGWLLGALALLCAGMAVYLWIVRRDRQSGNQDSGSQTGDAGAGTRHFRVRGVAAVAFSALVLAGVSAWLLAGAGSETERLREELYRNAVAVFREALALNDAVATMSLAARPAPEPPRATASTLIADYTSYLNDVNSLARLVRSWGRVVLTGVVEPDTVSSARITTRDDLLNAVRASTLTVYRGYLRIAERLEILNCRSEWFMHPSGRPLEQAVMVLPER